MDLRCLFPPTSPPLPPVGFAPRNISTRFFERRKSFHESEPSRCLIDRKLDLAFEGPELRHAETCCNCVLTKDSGAMMQTRNTVCDGDSNLNLLNVEESNDGFMLFKFGMANPCEDPAMFISSAESERKISAASTLSEYVSDAVISRTTFRGFSSKDSESFDFGEAFSGSTGQIFEGSIFDCSKEGSSFIPMGTAGNTNQAAFDNLTIPTLPKTNLEPDEHLSFPPVLIESPQPANSHSCFSPGSEESSIATSTDHDGFHFNSPHGIKVHFTDKNVLGGVDTAIGVVENTESSAYCIIEDVLLEKPKLSSPQACSYNAAATKRVPKTKKKSGLGQKKAGKVIMRDIRRRSSFQLYEIILSYPFAKSSEAVLNLQTVPKEDFGGLFNIFNHIAVGLAGSGLALVLFVASRMLSLNATLDSSKLMYLLRGIGLLWLSSALHKCGGAVKCMADVCTQARSQRKESLATLRREVQAVTFKACAVVVLSMVRFV